MSEFLRKLDLANADKWQEEIKEQNKREYEIEEAHYICPICLGNNTCLAPRRGSGRKEKARVRFICHDCCHDCLKSFGDYGYGFVID